MDIVSIIERVVSLGQQIAARLEAHKEAVESLKKLEVILEQLKNVVLKISDANVDKSHIVSIKDTLERTQNVYMRCAEDLNAKEKSHHNKFVVSKFKKVVGIYKAPNILAEIQRTIQDVENHLNITDKSLSIIQHAQVLPAPTITSTSTSKVTTSTDILKSELREALTNTIDELVTRLKNDCQLLQEKLDRCTLTIDPSFFEGLGNDNPEAISFWKDRFRSAELSISSIAPYENLYVSWARFVHELEITFQLKNIPTATKEEYFGSIDDIRRHGNRYYIDPNGTRNLKDIRPLWLPALRQALDPLHKGYIKPHDYLSFLGGESLSNKLRQIVFDSCGYSIFVECQRTSSDIALPSKIESPAHVVGWMSACQIISVPSPSELCIFIYDKNPPYLGNLIEKFTHPKNDIWVYVRYLQTGQIERKLLSEDVRMLGGLRIGITIAVRYTLENGSNVWSDSLLIVELKACAGGRYVVTAGTRESAFVFVTKIPIGFDDRAVQSDQLDGLADLPEFDYCLLGSSTVFSQEPKVGEKIQVRAGEFWHDVKVTAVNGEKVEYVDWDSNPDPDSMTNITNDTESDEDDPIGFTDDQLTTLEKNNEKEWCPWARGVSSSDIRPYRCLHVGDLVEAPVTYPDYLFRYYSLEESQLYLPARIIDIQGDQYLLRFSPAVTAYHWWPGRTSSEFPREPDSKETIKNPFDGTQVTIGMDQVRPCAAGTGPYPVLGIQSIRPQDWSAFQGIQFADLQQVDESILWK